MKKIFFFLPLFFLIASASFSQVKGFISLDVIVGNRPPNPAEQQLMSNEEAAHPNITKSMHDIQDALRHLREAPDTFGGHKGDAMRDLQQAWVSLRKALYYRIWQDTGH